MALVNGRDAADQETWQQVTWALGPFSKTVAKLREEYPGITIGEMITRVTEATVTGLKHTVMNQGAQTAMTSVCAALATALVDRERLLERVAELEKRDGI